MLSLFELNVEEAVWALGALVDISHHGVRCENLAAIDEQSDGRVLPQTHPFTDNCMELNRLEVVRDQEPVNVKGLVYKAMTSGKLSGRE